MSQQGPAPRRRRRRWLVVGIALVVVLAGAGLQIWRTVTDPLPAATAVAQRAAEALAARDLGTGVFGATAGPVEADDLAATLKGMGTLRPVITVESVQLDDEQRRGTARLRAEWVIHEGKPSWIQEAYLRLARGADGWTAVYQRDLIASGLEPGDRLRAVRLSPVRGEIIGADGERLVWNQDARRIGLDKPSVPAEEQPKAARALATAVGIDPDAYAATVAANGPKAYVEAGVVRSVGDEAWQLLDKVRGLKGVRIINAKRPLALSSSFARPVLGYVGEATADAIRQSGGTVRAGDQVGLSGLQKTFNSQLMGVTGFVVQAYPDGDVAQARTLFQVDAVPGQSLIVSLDEPLQTRAESVLAGAKGTVALVAIRPSDGALLAVASKPGTDTALSQRTYPTAFAPVAMLAAERGSTLDALDALGLSADAHLGVAAFGADVDNDHLRMSPIGLAAAFASVVCGETVRPFLVDADLPPAPADPLTAGEAKAIRAKLGQWSDRSSLAPLRALQGSKPLAAGEATWTVAARGDLVVAGYDLDERSAALVAALLGAAD